MIYSVQAPIASVIPVWFIALACCHYFWAGSTALSYALLSLYANICILFIAVSLVPCLYLYLVAFLIT